MENKASMIKLNNGTEIPAVGLGTWRMAPEITKDAVVEAVLNQGYRHLDLAAAYMNEDKVGEALKEIYEKSNGKITRKDLYLTSKLWSTHHEPKHVEQACRLSLKKLGTDYLDLYLVHIFLSLKFTTLDIKSVDDYGQRDPKTGKMMLEKVKMEDTWHAMEALVEKKLVRSIGVANFSTTNMMDLLNYAKIPPVVDQVECHPYFNQANLKDALDSFGVIMQAWSPLGGGKADSFMSDDVVKKIAQNHKKTVAQVALRWQIQRGIVVLPKSVHAERLKEDISIFDFELTADEMKEIDELGVTKKKRLNDRKEFYGYDPFD